MIDKPIDPLYRRLLGERFDQLPGAVANLHDLTKPTTWRGTCSSLRGRNLLAQFICMVLGLPKSGAALEMSVAFVNHPDGSESWLRRIANKTYRSRQWRAGPRLEERLSFVRLTYDVDAGPDGLALRLVALSAFAIPWPRALLPRVRTLETGDGEIYHFEIDTRMVAIGRLIYYRGELQRLT